MFEQIFVPSRQAVGYWEQSRSGKDSIHYDLLHYSLNVSTLSEGLIPGVSSCISVWTL